MHIFVIFKLSGLFVCMRIVTFSLQHTSVTGTDCGLHIVVPELETVGYIQSPNYPFDYKPGQKCKYKFLFGQELINQTPFKLCFNFRRYSLDLDSPCISEHLQFDGTIFCPDGVSQDETPRNIWDDTCWEIEKAEFIVEFQSAVESEHGTGFIATYWAIKEQQCDDGATFIEPSTLTFNLPCVENCSVGYMCDTQGYAMCQCVIQSSDTIAAPCEAEEWTCANRHCISKSTVCDLNNDCGDNSDEFYMSARCQSQDFSVNVRSCDFGFDLCGFLGLDGWQRVRAPRPDLVGHSPAGDHTTSGGWYLQAVFNNEAVVDGFVYFTSQPILAHSSHKCLNFWYRLTGSDATRLSVYLTDNTNSERERLLWRMKGNLGYSWHSANVVLEPVEKSTSIRFEAVRGLNFSHVAVDDIFLSSSPCQNLEPTCSFRTPHACGWTVAQGAVEDIPSSVQSRMVPSQTGAQSDETYLVLSRDPAATGTPSITTPFISAYASSHMCVRFRYMLTGSLATVDLNEVKISVKLLTYMNTTVDVTDISPPAVGQWFSALIDVELENPYQVQIAFNELSLNLVLDSLGVTIETCNPDEYPPDQVRDYECSECWLPDMTKCACVPCSSGGLQARQYICEYPYDLECLPLTTFNVYCGLHVTDVQATSPTVTSTSTELSSSSQEFSSSSITSRRPELVPGDPDNPFRPPPSLTPTQSPQEPWTIITASVVGVLVLAVLSTMGTIFILLRKRARYRQQSGGNRGAGARFTCSMSWGVNESNEMSDLGGVDQAEAVVTSGLDCTTVRQSFSRMNQGRNLNADEMLLENPPRYSFIMSQGRSVRRNDQGVDGVAFDTVTVPNSNIEASPSVHHTPPPYVEVDGSDTTSESLHVAERVQHPSPLQAHDERPVTTIDTGFSSANRPETIDHGCGFVPTEVGTRGGQLQPVPSVDQIGVTVLSRDSRRSARIILDLNSLSDRPQSALPTYEEAMTAVSHI